METKQKVNININRLKGGLPAAGAGREIVHIDGSFTAADYARLRSAYDEGKEVALTRPHPQYSTYQFFYWLMGVGTESLYFVTVYDWYSMQLGELVVNSNGGVTENLIKPTDLIGNLSGYVTTATFNALSAKLRGFVYADVTNGDTDFSDDTSYPEGTIGILHKAFGSWEGFVERGAITAYSRDSSGNPTDGSNLVKRYVKVDREAFFDYADTYDIDNTSAGGNPILAHPAGDFTLYLVIEKIDADSYHVSLSNDAHEIENSAKITVNRSDSGTMYYELTISDEYGNDFAGYGFAYTSPVGGQHDSSLFIFKRSRYSLNEETHILVMHDYAWKDLGATSEVDDLFTSVTNCKADIISLSYRVSALENANSNP